MNRSALESDLRELLEAQARVVHVSDPPSLEPLRPDSSGHTSRRRAGRVLSMVAALAVMVGGLAAIVATRDPAPASSSTPVATTATAGSPDAPLPAEAMPAATNPPVTPSVPPVAGPDRAGGVDPVAVLAQLAETSRLANEAVMEQTDECMASVGFEFERAERTDSPVAPIEQLYRPWSSPDPFTAAEFGYQPLSEMPANLLPPDSQRSVDYEKAVYGSQIGSWELAPEDQIFQEQALSGPILDGCFPSAQREIIGGGDPAKAFFINDSSYFLQSINNTAARAVLESDEIAALQPQWSECMAQVGYNYTVFTEVPGAFVGTNDADDYELAVATADAQCRDATGISDLGNQLFETAASSEIATRQDGLKFITTELDALTERAQAALN